jgi:RNA polymerase sigma-70 factor (ECF subfamily)
LVNVWDAASATHVAAAHAQAIGTSSAAVAASLGVPDDESAIDALFDAATRIASAVQLPVTVDIRDGYGMSASEMVERVHRSGAVGCNIEDSDHSGVGLLVDASSMADRLSQVRAAADELGVDLVINARVDSFISVAAGSMTEADALADIIGRAELYVEAGADCIYPVRLFDPSVAAQIVAAVDAPVNANWSPHVPLSDLAAAGVRRVSLDPAAHDHALRASTNWLLSCSPTGRRHEPIPRQHSGRPAHRVIATTEEATRRDISAQEFAALLEQHRAALMGFCYRMLGSTFDADDAVQDTMVRAWRAIDGFEGRAAFRSWLFRIATNVCLTLLASNGRRATPMDVGAPFVTGSEMPAPFPTQRWVGPIPDALITDPTDDPAIAATSRDTIRLAFVAALQYLPPRQRAVLILRDVLRWPTAEVAEVLGTTPVSIKSALQRARSTMRGRATATAEPAATPAQQRLLARYVDAFERYDMEALVDLLVEDATLSMPPRPMWVRGAAAIRQLWETVGRHCIGSQLVAVNANGGPAFAQYRRSPDGTGREAFALHVVVAVHRIQSIDVFVDPALFAMFQLPMRS